MRRCLGLTVPAALMAALLAAPAAAQDANRWAGLYLGLHGGHGSGEWQGAPSYNPGTGPVPGVFGADQRNIDATGWLGGAQIGFNVQGGPSLVWGVEVDGSWGDLEGDKAFVTPDKLYTWDIATRLEAMGTVRGRLGVLASSSLLIYGTAGLALGQTSGDLTVTSKDGFDPPQVTAVGSASENHVGWAAGGGLEWMFARNWSMKAEYVYVDLGSVSYRLTGTAYPDKAPCAGPVSSSCSFPHTTDSFLSDDLTFHTVKVGVNYKFD